LVPPIAPKKKKIMSNLTPLMFLACLFNTLTTYCLLLFCKILLASSSFYCSSFIILGVVHVCFWYWPNLSHLWTKTPHQFKFWGRIFEFENIC
jgi:hypothetical protein